MRVQVEFVDAQGRLYTQVQSHSQANNLYIQRMSEVINWPKEQFQGRMDIMQLNKPPVDYKPSYSECVLYFLIQNSQNNLRYYDQLLSSEFLQTTVTHAL